jgi:enediyne biosynthesis protein E4
VVVNAINGLPEILMNRSENPNHWIELQLVGVRSNRDGLGARIKLMAGGQTQWNQATTAVGYNSSSDRRVHFGLGLAATIDRIEIDWPSGAHQVLTGVKADQCLTVTEPAR